MAKLKLGDIKPETKGIEVTGRITSISERREVQTRFGPATLAIATLEDDTGSVRLNLWRSQIDLVRVGDSVLITNAFVKTFGGLIELNIGRDGNITAISKEK